VLLRILYCIIICGIVAELVTCAYIVVQALQSHFYFGVVMCTIVASLLVFLLQVMLQDKHVLKKT